MKIMAILNATPDSFSDGGELNHEAIVAAIEGGADILDVGGESTRPGHARVSSTDEIARVVPVIEQIRHIDESIPISIDTQKAAVAQAALAVGATMINDVSGLSDPAMGPLAAQAQVPIVLMRHEDCVGNIVDACRDQLAAIAGKALRTGVSPDNIILDPGLGFGERPGAHVEDNLALIDHIADYSEEFPVLIGGSRKRFVGAMMNEPEPKARLAGNLEVALRAQMAGASYLRVHDVEETREMLASSGFR